MPANKPPHEEIPVSAALWTIPDALGRSPSDTPAPLGPLLQSDNPSCPHRDHNLTRTLDAERQFQLQKQRYLDDLYPQQQQMYLESIATLPAYQGHDLAGDVLRKGLSMVHTVPDHRLPSSLYATLIATPAGEPLYWDNAYSSIANMTIYALDSDEEFRFDVMIKQLRPCKQSGLCVSTTQLYGQ